MKIYKTKKYSPIIFDYVEEDFVINFLDYYESKLYPDLITQRRTLKEINGEINNLDKTKMYKFWSRNVTFIVEHGIFYTVWGLGPVGLVYKDKDKDELHAAYFGNTSPAITTIVNKYFKSYGVKQKNIHYVNTHEFYSMFTIPVSFGLADMNLDVQKEISSKFLEEMRTLYPIVPEVVEFP